MPPMIETPLRVTGAESTLDLNTQAGATARKTGIHIVLKAVGMDQLFRKPGNMISP